MRRSIFSDRPIHVEEVSDTLRICTEEAAADPRISKVARERITGMHDFVVTLDDWYQQMIAVPPSRLMLLIRMGKRVLAFLPKGERRARVRRQYAGWLERT